MKSAEIRKKFLQFFEKNKHAILPSSSLVPDDPTMLLTTAGMVQFKPYFLGQEKPPYKRIATAQKCLRTTDIDNVGLTARHLTFFEMLGNFSLGDYYKKESIIWAWEFLTKIMKLDESRLYPTVYFKDEEAFDIWTKEVGIDPKRIGRLKEDNFWSAGETGPCGPSSEIIYDFGEEYSCGKNCKIGCDCDRWLEVWNLVFMQSDRDEKGKLTDLPNKNIDTGMGLERIAALTQNVKTNFDTDLLKPIVNKASDLSGIKYGANEKTDISLRIIADHGRAVAFLIADGVIPSNDGRGYVLRRLLRRVIRHGRLLGIEKPFIKEIIDETVKIMGSYYVELKEHKEFVDKIAGNEEERFLNTLKQGLQLLEGKIKEVKDKGKSKLSGKEAFNLYDTYGFPVELTSEIVEEEGLSIDMKQYEKLMAEQREKARKHWKGKETELKQAYTESYDLAGDTEFTGYEETSSMTEIKAIVKGKTLTDKAKEGQAVEVVLSKTPFYAERGGQVGDIGLISTKKGVVKVTDTLNPVGEMVVHKGEVSVGEIRTGEEAKADVDRNRRQAIARAHTATHILQWSLRNVLGEHVKQSGSLVEPDRLRFDFSHFKALTSKEIEKVERLVNQRILATLPVRCYVTTIDYAKEVGAVALFGEKYGKFVRVVEAGDFSKELCGGTHIDNTSQINLFRISHEGSIGANLRRIEAVTGERVYEILKEYEKQIKQISNTVKAEPQKVAAKVENIVIKLKEKENKSKKIIKEYKAPVKLIDINNIKYAYSKSKDMPAKELRKMSDHLRNKYGTSAIFLATEADGKAILLTAASKDLVDKGFHAGDWMKEIAPVIEGRGGGKPNLAQAGGKNPKKIDKAAEKALDYLKNWAKANPTGR